MNNEKEIWVDIKGYEGLYQISSFGRVKSLERYVNCDAKVTKGHGANRTRYYKAERILKPVNNAGYLYVNLCRDGNGHTSFAVHRLVAEAFIPNPDNLPQVNHKDEDKSNNYVENLEWCTSQYNINYGNCREKQRQALINNGSVRRGKNGRAKMVICDGIIYDCITDCAEHYGVSGATLSGYLCGCDPMPPRWKGLGLSYYREEAC